MSELVITCPICRRKFKITGDPNVFKNDAFRCPKCGYAAPFSVVLNWNQYTTTKPTSSPQHTSDIANKKTTIATNIPAPNEKTKISSEDAPSPSTEAYLSMPALNRRFKLKQGNFVLGRNSSDSKADIRLAPDPYMSREQALLRVGRSGNQTICQLTPLKTNNPVYLNGQPISLNTMATLHSGDKITMGKTTINFEIK